MTLQLSKLAFNDDVTINKTHILNMTSEKRATKGNMKHPNQKWGEAAMFQNILKKKSPNEVAGHMYW